MPYTVEDGNRLNNFAVEPQVYTSEPPTQAQKVKYLVLAGLGLALIGGLLAVAVSVSAIS